MTMKTVDLPFSPADFLARRRDEFRDQIADKIWLAIMKDDELKRARSRLSIYEFRRIVDHCLAASER